MKRITLFISLLCMMVGTALAQTANATPQAGKFYRVKANDKYLTIPLTPINATVAHGNVPMLDLDETNHGQVWFLESVKGQTNQYKLKSANGVDALSCTHGWNCNTSAEGSAISIEPASDPANTYIFRDPKKAENSNYFKVVNSADGAGVFPYSNAPVSDAAKWTLEEVDYVWVTYKYQVNGQDYASFKRAEKMNSLATVPAQPYVTPKNSTQNIGSEHNQTIVVSCDEALPFVASESFDKAHWQFIYMNGNKANCLKFNNTNNKVNYNAFNINAQGEDLEARMWCFVGNLMDGFKIYNKKAGTNVTLNATETNPTMGTASAGNDTWKLKTCRTAKMDAKQCCFTNDNGVKYMNMQGGELKYWGDNDGGSMCHFPEPKEFVLPNMDDTYQPLAGTLFGEAKVVGVVGKDQANELSTFVTKYDVIENAVETSYQDLTGLIDAYKAAKNKVTELASSVNTIESGYYFIYGTGNGNNANWRLTYEGTKCKAKALAANQKLGAEHVWYVEKVADGFKLQSCNPNVYLCLEDASKNGSAASNMINDKNNSHTFNYQSDGFGRLVIKNGNNEVLRTEPGGEVNQWWGDKDDKWYLVEATDLDLDITAVGYATVHFPFDVTLPVDGSVTAYAVEATNNTKGTVSLIAKTDIPANQGAIIKGAAQTHKLTIAPKSPVAPAAAAADWTNNKLKGSNVKTYVADNAYVLASPAGKTVGLYKANLNKDQNGAQGTTHFQVNANRAYLPMLQSGAAAVQFYGFEFNEDGTTGIENIQDAIINNGNAVIFDLSGRRVQNTTKGGIYIVNGKKVVR